METRYKRLGASRDVLTLLTGHQTAEMQDRYTILNRDDVALYMGKAAEEIPDYGRQVG